MRMRIAKTHSQDATRGAFLITELGDRIGLARALSEATAPTRERRSARDPGRVLRDLRVSVADGGDGVADLGALRGQEVPFGPVASETAAHRVVKSIDAEALDRIRAARAAARARALDPGARPQTITLDIDATLLPRATGCACKGAGQLARSRPKRIRHRLLHVAARLAFSGRRARLRLQASWPWAEELVAAFARLSALPAPSG